MSIVGWFTREPVAPVKPRIRRSVLEMICESAQHEHPNEFGGFLRVEKGVVTELLLIPGTVSGTSHAIFQMGMLPIDFTVKGTVHSHPGGNPRPSQADLELFRKYGTLHIIVAEPYDLRTWRGYDGRGNPIQFDVVDAT